VSSPCLNDLPEPYFTKSLAHLNAIQNAPSRHALFEALDIGLNYLRELSARHVLTLEETVELGRLWGDAADKRLRALPEQGAPASIHFFTKNPPLETTLDPVTQNALLHLLSLAERDTGQSRKAANFLLAWWNAVENGGFDLTDLYGLNQESASACAVLFGWLAKHDDTPKKLGYGTRFEALALKWRSRE
jgi:hypothetical protein